MHIVSPRAQLVIITFYAHQHKAAGVKTISKVLNNDCNGFDHSVFMVLRKEIALPRCRAMDRR